MNLNELRVAPKNMRPYRRFVLIAAAIQLFLLLFSALSLDMGEMFTSFAYAGIAFWAGVIVLVRRRPAGPTRGDRLFLCFGLPILSLFSLVVSPCIWGMLGKY